MISRTFLTAILAIACVETAHSQIKPDLAALESEAPRAGQRPSGWSSGAKEAIGTAYEAYDTNRGYSAQSPTAPLSKVWFTVAQGVLTESYWPTLDNPQVRDSQILVTDGATFFHEERLHSRTEVRWVSQGVPAFLIRNRDPQGRFEIERLIFTDPDRDSIVQRIRIASYVPGLKYFALHNPSIAGTPLGNSGMASLGSAPGPGLFAWQDDQAQALVFSIPFKKVSAGFSGSSDGHTDLIQDRKMDFEYRWARSGDVVLTAQLDLPETPMSSEFYQVLSFASSIDLAYEAAGQTLARDFREMLSRFSSQWQSYQSTVKNLGVASLDQGALFRASIAVLKSMEDKTFPGAYVASPTIPWGLTVQDWNSGIDPGESRSKLITGYHLVWPRDLFQMATTFMAVEDHDSAIASLNYLRSIQFKPGDGSWTFGRRYRAKDGSFPQNCWVNGESGWGSLQLDEVGMPIMLAYQLWKAGKIRWQDYWDMVRRAADFIQEFGPWTAQERWEERFGASPSTIAAEIAGLWTAAEFADAAGDAYRARRYRATADAWNGKTGDNLDTWLFTTSGAHGNGRYLVRLEGGSTPDQVWNPNDDATYTLANGGGVVREKDVVDGGFLELVRFGVRSALHGSIVETLPEYDATLRVEVPGHGPGFFRYLGDGYNYDEQTGRQTRGMVWPFLTGERAHYELNKAIEENRGPAERVALLDPYIRTLEAFATESGMLPEQVWDNGARAGQPTGAASPLGWTHGEYVKLLRSKLDRAVFDTIPLVRERGRSTEPR